jgi:hypothetical protein
MGSEIARRLAVSFGLVSFVTIVGRVDVAEPVWTLLNRIGGDLVVVLPRVRIRRSLSGLLMGVKYLGRWADYYATTREGVGGRASEIECESHGGDYGCLGAPGGPLPRAVLCPKRRAGFFSS